jgi:hypothetical protein
MKYLIPLLKDNIGRLQIKYLGAELPKLNPHDLLKLLADGNA